MADRTKLWIADTMKRLMAKKPLDKIRVTEICREAEIERPTFYYHFKDKFDLVAWMFYNSASESVRNSLKMGQFRSSSAKTRKNGRSNKDNRLAGAIRQCLNKAMLLESDYVKWGYTHNMWLYDTALAKQLGLVRMLAPDACVINKKLRPELEPKQKKTISAIYETFGGQEFSSGMSLAPLDLKGIFEHGAKAAQQAWNATVHCRRPYRTLFSPVYGAAAACGAAAP